MGRHRPTLLARIHSRLGNFPGNCRIVPISQLKEPGSIESGLLSPSLTIRRKTISDRYAKALQTLYSGH